MNVADLGRATAARCTSSRHRPTSPTPKIVAVTLEPEGGVPQPTGDKVLVGLNRACNARADRESLLNDSLAEPVRSTRTHRSWISPRATFLVLAHEIQFHPAP